MKKTQPVIKAFVIFLGLLPLAHAGGSSSTRHSSKSPMIMSAAIDNDHHAMVIEGYHFGTEAPVVRLGTRILPIKSHTPNQAVADLPADIRPATYRLTLTTVAPRRLTSEPFSTTIASADD